MSTGGYAAMTQRRLREAVRIGLLIVAFGEQCALGLPRLGGSAGELIAFGLLVVTAAGTAAVVLAGIMFTVWLRACGLTFVVAATAWISTALPAGAIEQLGHWYFIVGGWYLFVLLFDLPLIVLGTADVLYAAWFLVQAAVDGWSTEQLAHLGILAIGGPGFQFALALATRLIRRIGIQAESLARTEEHQRTAEAIGEQAQADYERRYARLRAEAVPLLSGLADGSLDPNDDQVRDRCAIEAARMRVLFAERDTAADPLIHELRAGLDVAERRGVTVDLAVRGRPQELPGEVRRGLLDPVLAEAVSARAHARITVLRFAGQVRVSAYSEHVDPSGGDWPAKEDWCSAEVRVSVVAEGEALWTETIWQPSTSPSR